MEYYQIIMIFNDDADGILYNDLAEWGIVIGIADGVLLFGIANSCR